MYMNTKMRTGLSAFGDLGPPSITGAGSGATRAGSGATRAGSGATRADLVQA